MLESRLNPAYPKRFVRQSSIRSYTLKKQQIDKMEITYYITGKDMIVARKFTRKTSPLDRRINTIGAFAVISIPGIVFLLTGGPFTLAGFIGMMIPTILMALLWIAYLKIVVLLIDKYSVKLLKKKSSGILGEHKIKLTAEEMIESTLVNESHIKWTAIQRVDENDEYIFIRASYGGTYVIPKRDFINSVIAKQFYDLAHTYHQKSQTI
jgi:YcxB-like protein